MTRLLTLVALRLASVFASLLLVCASGETIDSRRAAVQGAGLTRSVNASTDALACDSSMACFDIFTNDPRIIITHIIIDSGCATTASQYSLCAIS